MSATRPKAGSPEQELQLEELEELEELGDEAIISQQTAAHTPQPRANVSEESRSVVITEHVAPAPAARPEPARNSPHRSSAEATLVIRDRRALDEMRQKIVRRQKQQKARSRNALYLWGALGLAAFVLGGIVAFLATDTHPDAPTADNQGPGPRIEAQMAAPSTPLAVPSPTGSAASPPRAVRVNDLPVEPPRPR
ncbi:MAG TPA: hypothetical protein VGC79_07795 [Polyangiaceae bacterium]